jgi:hypothetical protein
VRTITVGGQKQRVPETGREHAGQAVAAAAKSLRMALAFERLEPGSLSLVEKTKVLELVMDSATLAMTLGYEVRS